MEAEAGVMLPQAKEHLEEARKDSRLEALEGAWSCGQLDFRLLASRSVRE